MSKITLAPNASGTGTLTVAAPNTNTDYTLTLPTATGTINTSGLANEVPSGSAGSPSIYPTGDSNTGIFFPAADTIAFSEGGVEAMRIDSSGNVGIGVTPFTNTTSFSAGKDPTIVNDGSFFGGGLYYDSAWRNTVASQGGWALRNTAGVFTVFTGPANGAAGSSISASERLRIADAGQIGIGGANYGTSGQVLTSGGSGAAPSWTSRGFASAVLTDKTGSRANGTTYQNTTNGWLFVSVRDSNNGQSFSVGPSSASLTIFNTNIAPGTAIGLVPPLYYYSISGSVLQSWYEGQA
jgi:hypothetical protein